MLYEEGFTQNREISWLRYNERVLEEALDDTVPLFERLRFIAIFVSNLEEFFKVRVGSLLGEDDEGWDTIDEKSGMTAADQLRRIHDLVPGLLMKKDMAYGLVERKLADEGVVRLEPWQLNEEERGRCFDFFRDEVKDSLIVRVLDADDPMPAIDEERPYIISTLDAELEDKFGSLDQAFQKMQAGSVKATRTLLWAGLLHEDEKLTERQVGAMISLTNVESIMEQITEALTAALPEDTGADGNAVAPDPQ